MKKILIPLVAVMMTGISGCASVINGTTQDLTFKSEPEGATVLVDGLERGKTPVTVTLQKNEHQTVTFRKNGYKDVVVALDKKMDPIAWLNIFWDLSTTDAMTGALYEYQPSAHYVTLKKEN